MASAAMSGKGTRGAPLPGHLAPVQEPVKKQHGELLWVDLLRPALVRHAAESLLLELLKGLRHHRGQHPEHCLGLHRLQVLHLHGRDAAAWSRGELVRSTGHRTLGCGNPNESRLARMNQWNDWERKPHPRCVHMHFVALLSFGADLYFRDV